MLTALRPQRRSGRGFTLVELAGVILVIMILAAIAIPTFQVFQTRSRGSAVDTSADRIANSLFALAQQGNAAANKGADILDAFNEIPEADRNGFGVDGFDGTLYEDIDRSDRYENLVIVQRFGDKVRAGCLVLPPNNLQGETPFFARHGHAVDDLNAPVWVTDNGTNVSNARNLFANAGEYVNVAATDGSCTSTTEPEAEGMFVEIDPSVGPNVADIDNDETTTADQIEFDY